MRITENRVQTYETKHAERVAKSAAECTILLKKDGHFPLRGAGEIALYGAGIRHTIRGGSGSGEVNIRRFETVEESMEATGFTVTSKSWLDAYDRALDEAGKAFYQQIKAAAEAAGVPTIFAAIGQIVPEPEYEFPIDGAGNTAIYVLSRNSAEGSDRTNAEGNMRLTTTEIRDILAANTMYENFMLVLNVGGVVDLTPIMEVKNILLLGQLGTPTSKVLADILLGKQVPSGKLTATWAAPEAYPSTAGFGALNDTLYREGIYVGYRYFDLAEKNVIFPFGYGLGYTDFRFEPESVRVEKTRVTVSVNVTNIGQFPGKEVVQLYVTAPGQEIDRPWKELAAAVKTSELKPGEYETIELSFDLLDHLYYEEATASCVLEGGTWLVHAGTNSENPACIGKLDVTKSICAKKLKNVCPCTREPEELPELSALKERRNVHYQQALAESASLAACSIDLTGFETETVRYSSTPAYKEAVTKNAGWQDVLSGKLSEEAFAASLTDKELAMLACGSRTDEKDPGSIIGAASDKVAGAAGETNPHLFETRGIPSLVTADGPAGVRISPICTIRNGKARSAVIAFGSDMGAFLPPEDMAVMKAMLGITEENTDDETYYQYCTAIPVGTAVAQSFNPGLAEEYGDIVGTEMELFGVSIWLAPALNIQRNPLCGRNFEYYSEDPIVGGLTAAAVTRGVQRHAKRGVTIKHFACNNQETNRYRNNSVVSERALREIYLKGFELAIREAKPAAVMTSYNLINGEHACNSHDLLTAVLRDEWDFDGIVMTDWFVTSEQVGSTEDAIYPSGTAAGCVKAGNNLTMPGQASDVEDIMKALSDPSHPYALARADLIHNAAQMLRFIRRFS